MGKINGNFSEIFGHSRTSARLSRLDSRRFENLQIYIYYTRIVYEIEQRWYNESVYITCTEINTDV